MKHHIHRSVIIPVMVLLTWQGWAGCRGQVTLTSADLHEYLIGPTSLFDCGIGSSVSTEVNISGEVLSSAGEPIVSFVSRPRSIPAGGTHLRANDLSFSNFTYSATSLGRMVAMTHQLPGGRYRWCLRIAPASDDLDGDELCEEVEVADLLSMDPLWPLDGDTIDEVRPTISWTLSRLPLPSNQSARLVLVPCPGRDPAAALAAERPVFIVDGAGLPAVPYPVGAPALIPGSAYAWQVERSLDGVLVDRTEPWRFVVRKYIPPGENKYVRLDAYAPGSVYEALDHRIFFRYDEAYANGGLSCFILDERGSRLKVEPAPDGSGKAISDPSGPNLFELDLQQYDLRPGYYVLLVKDAKGHAFELKFHIAR